MGLLFLTTVFTLSLPVAHAVGLAVSGGLKADDVKAPPDAEKKEEEE